MMGAMCLCFLGPRRMPRNWKRRCVATCIWFQGFAYVLIQIPCLSTVRLCVCFCCSCAWVDFGSGLQPYHWLRRSSISSTCRTRRNKARDCSENFADCRLGIRDILFFCLLFTSSAQHGGHVSTWCWDWCWIAKSWCLWYCQRHLGSIASPR